MDTAERFSASLDTSTRILTLIAILICVLPLGIVAVVNYVQPGHTPLGVFIMLVLVPLLVTIIPALLAPRGYLVMPGEIRIQRLAGAVRIPLTAVTEVQEVDGRQVFHHAVRIGASGGMFGFFGYFQSPGMGSFLAYATRRDRTVAIRRAHGDPVIITPDNPARFVALAREAMGGGITI